MNNINAGDTVRRISGKNHGMEEGDVDIVESVSENTVTLRNYGAGHSIDKLEVIKSNARCTASAKPQMLKKLNVFIKKHLDVKMQSLLKAGYRNGDLQPTAKGDRALLDLLHTENHDALAASADAEIAEAEAEEAKNN